MENNIYIKTLENLERLIKKGYGQMHKRDCEIIRQTFTGQIKVFEVFVMDLLLRVSDLLGVR